jgi:hypothetical protein
LSVSHLKVLVLHVVLEEGVLRGGARHVRGDDVLHRALARPASVLRYLSQRSG